MIFSWRLCLVFCLICWSSVSTAAAPSMYISDRLQVLLRAEPSPQATSLATLSTGALLTILNDSQESWVQVRTPDGKEGWLLRRYLVVEPPAALRIKELEPQDKNMSQRLEELQQENKNGKDMLTQAQNSLRELEKSYQQLSADAAGALRLRDDYERVKLQLQAQTEQLDKLASDNEGLRFATNLRWFLAGGGVLLVGWLMGLAFGRRKKSWTTALR